MNPPITRRFGGFSSLLIASLFAGLGMQRQSPAPKHFGGKYNNNRNHGGGKKRKNPFRGTTYASVIGVSSHVR